MSPGDPVPQLVVVGSSAGGIEALSVLVGSLPGDFPAPIILAQHLDPSRPSRLDQILQRRTTLPVRMVVDHEALEPGTIYVVPSNRHVAISDHDIDLRGGPERPIPSVDLLLSSAAASFGDGLIAVILTGTGTDGTNGARIVHEAGGVVIIQDPSGAEYPSMPRSLAPNTVDLVADLPRIGPLLGELLRGRDTASLPDERERLQRFLDEVRERFGLDFGSYKEPTIRRRLRRRMVATGTGDLEEYIRYLDEHPEEYARLFDSFLIKVTQFFRDPELFDYLRGQVLPEIVEQARQQQREIRIWSAGCATGEEAYSLGITVAEVLGEELDLFDVRIFATDADPDAIAYARAGAYTARALAEVPADILARYFTHEEGLNYVRKRVRSLIVFGEHDLGKRPPFPRIDLVLCRNVLIYFTPELQRYVLRSFAYSLRNEGVLVLGKSETTSPLADYFELEESRLRVYRRRGERLSLLPVQSLSPTPMSPPRAPFTEWSSHPPAAARRPETGAAHAPSLANNEFLLSLPVGIVVINRHYDIQAINAPARALLGIHRAAIGEDLIHIARDLPYDELRNGIDSAFRDGSDGVVMEVSLEVAATGAVRHLKLTCYPLGERKPAAQVAIAVEDITSAVIERRALQRDVTEAADRLAEAEAEVESERAQRREQVERLLRTNQEINDSNRELTRLNEELRSRNEELMLMTEEAQAASEEVETLNEELQATNEELETLNEELQATNEELNTTNDELQSRTVEIQRIARDNDGERARLEAILRSMADSVMVVRPDEQIMLANDAFRQTFGEPGAAPGRLGHTVLLDEEGRTLPPELLPQRQAALGKAFKLEFTVWVEEEQRRFYEATGSPIAWSGEVEGGVVVVRDITDRSLRRLQDEFLSFASHELRNPLTALQSYVQLLLRYLERKPDDIDLLRHHAESALRQTRQMGRLIGDLIDATRLQHGRYQLDLEDVRLDRIVAQATEVAEGLAGDQRIVVADGEPLVARGDAGRLEQVTLNLLQNAITYAPESERIDVRLAREGDWAVIEVQDYGPGIPPAELPNLFTRFYQPREPNQSGRHGLGLGLYISRQITEAHGGTIGVTTGEGQGATFRVRLPLAGPEAPAGAEG